MVKAAGEKVSGDKGAQAVRCGAVVFGVRKVECLQLKYREVFVDAHVENNVEIAGREGEGGTGDNGGRQKFFLRV